jgi:hypothetical protein
MIFALTGSFVGDGAETSLLPMNYIQSLSLIAVTGSLLFLDLFEHLTAPPCSSLAKLC